MKNCINCGAPLIGRKCAYCGTEYTENGNIQAEFDAKDGVGTVNIMGQKYTCYVSKMEACYIDLDPVGRDMSGRLIRGRTIYKHKFTMVEV